MLTVACIQMNSQDDVAANIEMALSLMTDAAKQGAQFITLPENAFYMGSHASIHHPHFTQESHPAIPAMQHFAKEYAVWVLVGSLAVAAGETKSFNRSLLIDAQGTITATYDKIHLFDVSLSNGETYTESARFEGGSKAVLADTPWGKLGLSICYDLRFPHLYRTLAQAGAVMISAPAAFTAITGVAHWHALIRARAIENGCFVIAPAQTGNHPGNRQTFGHSLIVSPWGEVMADGGADAQVTLATIDLSASEALRKNLPSLTHDRKFTL